MADSTQPKQEPTPLTEEQVEALAERFTASWESLDDSAAAEEGGDSPGASPAAGPNLKRTMLGLAPTTQAAIPQKPEPGTRATVADRPSDSDLQTTGSVPRQRTLLGIQAPDPALVEKIAAQMSSAQPSSAAPATPAAPAAPSPAPGYGAGMLAPPPDRGPAPANPAKAPEPTPESAPVAIAPPTAEPVALGPSSPKPGPARPTPPAADLTPLPAAQAESPGAESAGAARPPIVGWGPPAVVAPTPQKPPEPTSTGAEAATAAAAPEPSTPAPEPASASEDVSIDVSVTEPVTVPVEVDIAVPPAAAPEPAAAPSLQPAPVIATAGTANGSAPAYAPPSAPPQSSGSGPQPEERSVVVEDESVVTRSNEAEAAAARLAQHADTIPPERPRLVDLDVPPDFKAVTRKKLGLWIGAVLVLGGIGAAVALSGGAAVDPGVQAEQAPDLKAAVTTAANTKHAEPAPEPEPEPKPADQALETADATAAEAQASAPAQDKPGVPPQSISAPVAPRPQKVATPVAPKPTAGQKVAPTPVRKTTKAKKPKAKSKTIVRDAPF